MKVVGGSYVYDSGRTRVHGGTEAELVSAINEYEAFAADHPGDDSVALLLAVAADLHEELAFRLRHGEQVA